MASRQSLQTLLETLLGSSNVYYQPPESMKLSYPCILFNKSSIRSRFADDGAYSLSTSYDITVLDREPDNPVIEKLLELPYSNFNRHYVAENLNHDVIVLYY